MESKEEVKGDVDNENMIDKVLLDLYEEAKNNNSVFTEPRLYQGKTHTLLEHLVTLHSSVIKDKGEDAAKPILKRIQEMMSAPESYWYGSPLALALQSNNLVLAEKMLDVAIQAKISASDFMHLIQPNNQRTILAYAISLAKETNNEEDPDKAYQFIKKLLKYASTLKLTSVVNQQANICINPVTRENRYYLPIQLAIIENKFSLVELFLNNDANLSLENGFGTPLYCAATYFSKNAFKAILEKGMSQKVDVLSYVHKEDTIADALCVKLKNNKTEKEALECLAAFLCSGGKLPNNPKYRSLLHKHRESLFDECNEYINNHRDLYTEFNKRLADQNDLCSIFYNNSIKVKFDLLRPLYKDPMPTKIVDFRSRYAIKDAVIYTDEEKCKLYHEFYYKDYKKGHTPLHVKNFFSTGIVQANTGKQPTWGDICSYANLTGNEKNRAKRIVAEVNDYVKNNPKKVENNEVDLSESPLQNNV